MEHGNDTQGCLHHDPDAEFRAGRVPADDWRAHSNVRVRALFQQELNRAELQRTTSPAEHPTTPQTPLAACRSRRAPSSPVSTSRNAHLSRTHTGCSRQAAPRRGPLFDDDSSRARDEARSTACPPGRCIGRVAEGAASGGGADSGQPAVALAAASALAAAPGVGTSARRAASRPHGALRTVPLGRRTALEGCSPPTASPPSADEPSWLTDAALQLSSLPPPVAAARPEAATSAPPLAPPPVPSPPTPPVPPQRTGGRQRKWRRQRRQAASGRLDPRDARPDVAFWIVESDDHGEELAMRPDPAVYPEDESIFYLV